jgi:hypothetical protein
MQCDEEKVNFFFQVLDESSTVSVADDPQRVRLCTCTSSFLSITIDNLYTLCTLFQTAVSILTIHNRTKALPVFDEFLYETNNTETSRLLTHSYLHLADVTGQ